MTFQATADMFRAVLYWPYLEEAHTVSDFAPTFDQVRRYFESRLPGQRIGSRREVSVKCRFHDDRTASMSVNLEKATWFCHACNTGGGILDFERKLTGKPDVECWAAINLTIGRDASPVPKSGQKRIVATYDYPDAAEKVIYQAVRYDPKGFSQRQPDGKGGWTWNMDGVTRVPFNLPALVRANVALITEGEKDSVNSQKASAEFPNENGKLIYAATCNVGGAGKWPDDHSPYLAGKKVFVFPDNDKAGREHAQQVCTSVSKYAQAVHLVELPGLAEHGDVSDYLEKHTPAELFELMKAAPVWTAPAAQVTAKKKTEGYDLVPVGELLARPVVPPDYLVDGILVRGTVSCVAAKPKVGKSTFARGLSLAVARGTSFLGRSCLQGSCIYIALEERYEEITIDFRAMGTVASDPISVHAAAAPVEAILALITLVREQRPALVAIDPLFRLARVRDEKAYAEVYAAMGPLIDLARETGTHILLTHHAGKSLKSDAIDSPLGSTALGGSVATLLVLKRVSDYRTLQTVQRIGTDMPETVLTFDEATHLLSVGGSKAEADCNALEKEIAEYLEGTDGKTEQEIGERVEGKTTVKRRALRSLAEKGLVARTGSGKKGDPYIYSFPCSQHIAGTSEQESQNSPQARANIEEKLVPENGQNQVPVPDGFSGEKGGVSDAPDGEQADTLRGATKPEVWL